MDFRISLRIPYTEDDADLIAYLDSLPSRKRSEIIRNMLRFAFNGGHGNVQQFASNSENNEQILNKLEQLQKEMYEQHTQMLAQLETIKGSSFVNVPTTNNIVETEEDTEEIVIDETIDEDTAMMFLGAFSGGAFDMDDEDD